MIPTSFSPASPDLLLAFPIHYIYYRSHCNCQWNQSWTHVEIDTSSLLMFTYCPMFYVLLFAWEIACTHSIPLLLKGGKSWPGSQSNSAVVANIGRKKSKADLPTSRFIYKKTNPTLPPCIISKQYQSRLSNAQKLCIPEVFITSVFQGGIVSFEQIILAFAIADGKAEMTLKHREQGSCVAHQPAHPSHLSPGMFTSYPKDSRQPSLTYIRFLLV